MPDYLINIRAGERGEHEVHETTCGHLPEPSNRLPIGWYADCHQAVKAARSTYPTADGCYYCCPACHRK